MNGKDKPHCRVGIRLERFSRDNAELVLRWRNAAHVRANSLDDVQIELEGHLRFLDDVVSAGDRHLFVLHLDDKPQAALSVSVSSGVAHWGCYIGGDPDAPRPGLFPILIALAGELAFGLFDCAQLHSDVVRWNTAPQKMNAFLGIGVGECRRVTRPGGEEIDVISYFLDRSDWPAVRTRIRAILTKNQIASLDGFAENPLSSIA